MTTPDAGQAKPSSQNTRLIEDKDRQRLIDWFQSSADCWTNDKEFSEVIAMLRADAAEIERLRGVEARYKWLKSSSPEGCWWSEYAPNPHDFDACIDAAIAASHSTGAADAEEDHG